MFPYIYANLLQGTINIPRIDYEALEDENYIGKRFQAVAIDCQMVGCGSDGSLDLLARVCLVDEEENIIFHTYVQPQISVTDYRYSCADFFMIFHNCFGTSICSL